MCDFINLLFLSGKFIKKFAAKTFQEAFYTSLRSVECLSIVYDRTSFVAQNNMLELINSRVHELNQFLGYDGEIHVALIDDKAKSELDAFFKKINRPFVPFNQVKTMPLCDTLLKTPSHILLAHLSKHCHNVVKDHPLNKKKDNQIKKTTLQELIAKEKNRLTKCAHNDLNKAVEELMTTQKNLLSDLGNLLDCLTEINALDKYLQFKSIEDGTITLDIKKNLNRSFFNIKKEMCEPLPNSKEIMLNEVVGVATQVSEKYLAYQQKQPNISLETEAKLDKDIVITADPQKKVLEDSRTEQINQPKLLDSTSIKSEPTFAKTSIKELPTIDEKSKKVIKESLKEEEKLQDIQKNMVHHTNVLSANENHFAKFEIFLKDVIYKQKLEILRQKVLHDCKLMFQNKRQFNKIESKILKEMYVDNEQSKRVFVVNKKMDKIMQELQSEMLNISKVLQQNEYTFNNFEDHLNQIDLTQSAKNIAKLLNRTSLEKLEKITNLDQTKKSIQSSGEALKINYAGKTFNQSDIDNTQKLLEANECSFFDFQKRLSLINLRHDVKNMSKVLEMNSTTFVDFQKSLQKIKVKQDSLHFSKVINANEETFNNFQKSLNFNEVKQEIPNITKLVETNDKSFDELQKRLLHQMSNSNEENKLKCFEDTAKEDNIDSVDQNNVQKHSEVVAVSDSIFDGFLKKLAIRKKFEVTKHFLSVGQLDHFDYFTKFEERLNEQKLMCTILGKHSTTDDNCVVETCIPLIEVNEKNTNNNQLREVDGKMMLICNDVYMELLCEIEASKINDPKTEDNSGECNMKKNNFQEQEECNIKKINFQEQREHQKIREMNEKVLSEFEEVLNTVKILQKPPQSSKSDDEEVQRFLKNKEHVIKNKSRKFCTKSDPLIGVESNSGNQEIINFDQIVERIRNIKNDINTPNKKEKDSNFQESAEEIERQISKNPVAKSQMCLKAKDDETAKQNKIEPKNKTPGKKMETSLSVTNPITKNNVTNKKVENKILPGIEIGKEIKIDKDLEKRIFQKEINDHQKKPPQGDKKLSKNKNTAVADKKLKRPPFEGRVVKNGKIVKPNSSKCELKLNGSKIHLWEKAKQLILEELPAKTTPQSKSLIKYETDKSTKALVFQKPLLSSADNQTLKNLKLPNKTFNLSNTSKPQDKKLSKNDPAYAKKNMNRFKSSTTSSLLQDSSPNKVTKSSGKKMIKKITQHSEKENLTQKSSSFSYVDKDYRQAKMENICEIFPRVEDENNNSNVTIREIKTNEQPVQNESNKCLQLHDDKTITEKEKPIRSPPTNDISLYKYNNSLLMDEFSCMILEFEGDSNKIAMEKKESVPCYQFCGSDVTDYSIIYNKFNNKIFDSKTAHLAEEKSKIVTPSNETEKINLYTYQQGNVELKEVLAKNTVLGDPVSNVKQVSEEPVTSYYAFSDSKVLKKEIKNSVKEFLFDNQRLPIYDFNSLNIQEFNQIVKDNVIKFMQESAFTELDYNKLMTRVNEKDEKVIPEKNRERLKEQIKKNLDKPLPQISKNINKLIQSKHRPHKNKKIGGDVKNPQAIIINQENIEPVLCSKKQTNYSDINKILTRSGVKKGRKIDINKVIERSELLESEPILYTSDALLEDEDLIKPYESDTDLMVQQEQDEIVEEDILEADNDLVQNEVEVLYFDESYIATPPSVEDAASSPNYDIEIELIDEKDITDLIEKMNNEEMEVDDHLSTLDIDELIDNSEDDRVTKKIQTNKQDCSKIHQSFTIVNKNAKLSYNHQKNSYVISPQIKANNFSKKQTQSKKNNRMSTNTEITDNKGNKYKFTTKNIPLILGNKSTKVTYLIKE